RVEADVELFHGLLSLVDDLLAANELAVEGDDAEMGAEVTEGIAKLNASLGVLETESLFSGDMDDHDVVMSIHPGAGGTDAQDWADMLLRMYLRWAERRRYQTEILDLTEGEEAGIKSATVEIT